MTMKKKNARQYNNLPWEQWFELARAYYDANGNLLVPKKHVVRGYSLGRWIERQGAAYNKKAALGIPAAHIRLLESIGMVWRLELRDDWVKWYALAERFYRENGHLRIERAYAVGDYRLGNWLCEQKKKYVRGELSAERISALERISIEWAKPRVYRTAKLSRGVAMRAAAF